MRHRLAVRALLSCLPLVLLAAACGSDDDAEADATTTTSATDESAPETSGETLVLGYSAWPGWFPLAVAEEAGIFEQVGLDVDLKYFADYLGSLDALAAGELDGNTQTLNDTMFSVASGTPEVIVVVNDNSTGNDAIICDESITSIAELAGKTIAAEPGVVDHFLLLQGLEKAGMTEDDIDFQGLKTDAAAAAFEGGQFDCVGVFAPFTVQALNRPGSHAVFTSADFPGVIPDHLVATEAAAGRSGDMAKLVEAWYLTLQWIEENPDEATTIMAEQAQVTVEEYEDFESGTTLFSPDEAVNAFEDRAGDPTSLPEMARRINPFLVSSGLAQEEADLTGIFEPSYTEAYAEKSGS